ncbi:hypothetical protein KSF_108540 [Reticulibacter mediterranei]|uniref:Uncharacterized protein n=2 Tax=Reticulibacter mediterranei TaxID=2778369 RepID=A0A8J3J4Z0_9CHLR|nr:hypothetical protein KSF_108540 [Reticulibacter mediterranei]
MRGRAAITEGEEGGAEWQQALPPTNGPEYLLLHWTLARGEARQPIILSKEKLSEKPFPTLSARYPLPSSPI